LRKNDNLFCWYCVCYLTMSSDWGRTTSYFAGVIFIISRFRLLALFRLHLLWTWLSICCCHVFHLVISSICSFYTKLSLSKTIYWMTFLLFIYTFSFVFSMSCHLHAKKKSIHCRRINHSHMFVSCACFLNMIVYDVF